MEGLELISKSWAHSPNHKDSSIHLRPTPTPNFLRSYFVAQKFGVGHKTAYEIDPWSVQFEIPSYSDMAFFSLTNLKLNSNFFLGCAMEAAVYHV